MDDDLRKLKYGRRVLNLKLDDEMNSTTSYEEKFILIYKIILTSQLYYAKYIGANIFDDDYFKKLLEKFRMANINNDIAFYNFIKEELIKPLHSGHLGLKFQNDYLNKFVVLYLQFIKENNIDMNVDVLNKEIDKLLKIEDIDEEKFKNFLQDSVLSSMSLPEKKKSQKNLTIRYMDDTVIIKIRSFNKCNLKNDSEELKQLSKIVENGNFKNVIFDIRDNQGGTDEYFKYFDVFSNQDIICTLRCYNLFTKEVEEHSWKAIPKGTDKEYNRFLLINGKCFSAADIFVRLCKNNHFATIVGEETRGEGYGMTPVLISINTKFPMILRVPVEAPINDLDQIDYEHEYNVKPDIFCLEDMALSEALSLIKKSKGLNHHKN